MWLSGQGMASTKPSFPGDARCPTNVADGQAATAACSRCLLPNHDQLQPLPAVIITLPPVPSSFCAALAFLPPAESSTTRSACGRVQAASWACTSTGLRVHPSIHPSIPAAWWRRSSRRQHRATKQTATAIEHNLKGEPTLRRWLSTRRCRWMRTYLGHLTKRCMSRFIGRSPPMPALATKMRRGCQSWQQHICCHGSQGCGIMRSLSTPGVCWATSKTSTTLLAQLRTVRQHMQQHQRQQHALKVFARFS